jgi:ABC-2 type transport system ATP-binding protein
MIRAQHLTKRFGPRLAVDDLSFEVQAGAVTGFLGPNGAGKTTTLRLILGLAHSDKGSATINGQAYRDLRSPMREVGALLDAKAYHPGRKARDHLLALAQAARIDPRRVDEVLGIVGLAEVANKRAGTFSLGMAQRLGIAGALLGDPGVLIFDEPVNGLDPEGIVWARNLMQALAGQGRTVFVSSHLMSEMALTATNVIVIGRGHLIVTSSIDELVRRGSPGMVRLRTPAGAGVLPPLQQAGGQAHVEADGTIIVSGLQPNVVGDVVFRAGAPVYALTPVAASLEEVFMDLTREDVEYHAGTPGPPGGAPTGAPAQAPVTAPAGHPGGGPLWPS